MTFIAIFFGALGMAQAQDSPADSAPADLVYPLPGHALWLEQVEERSRKRPDGTAVTEATKSKIYRDSSGRVRIEWEYHDTSGQSSTVVVLIEPAVGSRVVLLGKAMTAYRVVGAKAGKNGFGLGVAGIGEPLPPGDWKTKTESVGRRTIEGIDFEGTRVTLTSKGPPPLIAVRERWYSRELKLTGLASSSGPSGRSAATIQNLHHEEPDPALFTIPSDYNIVDLEVPDTEGQ